MSFLGVLIAFNVVAKWRRLVNPAHVDALPVIFPNKRSFLNARNATVIV
jgi:hypothetical protein